MPGTEIPWLSQATQAQQAATQARATAVAVRDEQYHAFWGPEAAGSQVRSREILDADRHRLTPAQVALCEGFIADGDAVRRAAAFRITDGDGLLAAGDGLLAQGDATVGTSAYQAIDIYQQAQAKFMAASSLYSEACQYEHTAMDHYKKVSDYIVALNLPPE